jgi:hypothetical protein
MPAHRSKSPLPSSSSPARTRDWHLHQAAAAIADTETAFSPLDLVGKTRKRPIRGLLSSTSFRAKLKKILDDESLDPVFSPEVVWAAGMSMGCELMEEVTSLRAEVS